MRGLLVSAWACLACGSAASALGPVQPPVTVETGQLSGVTAGDVTAYKGVPFAAPPVGPLRWRPPQPAPAWAGVRRADAFGHDPAQLPFAADMAPLTVTPAEDCLYLNVWRPAHPPAAKLPVLVWIYGGGFVNGGTSPAVYDGSAFARDGVCFVSFNYRLGRFGFFAHPALTRAEPDGPLGNYAYLDQIAALKWVRRNIEAFGGDPANVTIFGESAGGLSVHALMTSPLARGLFQKAIVQSGLGRATGNSQRLHDRVAGKPSAEDAGVAFAKANGITGDDAAALDRLRALPADAVVGGLNLASMGQGRDTYTGPILDGKVVVEEPQQAYAAGTQARVPVIVGATDADAGFAPAKTVDDLFAVFGPDAAAARAAYDPGHAGDLRTLGAQVGSDAVMVEPARFVARTLARAGQPVWEYRFSYVATSLRTRATGAGHATELPFVFDTAAARYGPDLSADDRAAAVAVHRCWTQFAKTGDPTAPGGPPWPRYAPAADRLMDFTVHGPVARADPWQARLDLTAARQP